MTASDAMRAVRRASARPWLLLLCGCVLLVAVAETALLLLTTSYLGSGYNAPRIDLTRFLLLFLPGAVLLDAWLVLLIWTVTLPLLSRLISSRLQVFGASALLAGGIPAALAGLRYNVYSMLGGMFSVVLVSGSSTLGPSALLAEAITEAPGVILAALPLGLATLVGFQVAKRIERRFGPVERLAAPPLRQLSYALVLTGGLAASALGLAAWKESPLLFGFEARLSGGALSDLIASVTDVDGDGFGLLQRPSDPAPFDPTSYSYAVDVPGNGRDENGIGGDHPLGFDSPEASAAPVAFERRPHVLLVYLESFRTDLLGATLNGREITPFLNRLAAEGGSSSHAYIHSPWTLASRMHLISGRMLHTPGDATLVDDFKSRGYTVAWFSGQDDSYGDSDRSLGADRADVFYDARQDLDRRTSRSTASISLQVSWKTLVGRTLDYLSEVDTSKPLFLYLNVVDTHYPYSHAEIDAVLGTPPLERDGVRAWRAREVYEAYANSAANVDRAVEIVFDVLRRRLAGADLAVVVTADHGESFYEQDVLGHGQSLDPVQTRVPFIVWGMGGEWPEPIAASDVRGLLMRNLSSAGPPGEVRPRFAPEPGRRVLQYAPTLERPGFIGLRGAEDLLLFDFSSGRASELRGDGDPAVPVPLGTPPSNELIWRWEAVQRRALEPDAGASERVRAAQVVPRVGS